MTGGEPTVSVIVPTLNEAPRVSGSLRRMRRDFPQAQLIVADGGSTDGTRALAAAHATVVTSRPGRGRQLNAGASAADGGVLWFVHADTVLHSAAPTQLRVALTDPRVVGGGCTLRFDRPGAALRYLAWASNQRARRLGQVFGDQAMFVRRGVFEALGGFPDYPLMEDFELTRRLHRIGRLTVLAATATASARRFDEHGTVAMIAFMQALKVMYLAGVSPQRLAVLYDAGPSTLVPHAGRANPAMRHEHLGIGSIR